MLFADDRENDPDDLFKDTRMSFGDHLEDLRLHLWRAIIGFLIAMVVSFFICRPAMYWVGLPWMRSCR